MACENIGIVLSIHSISISICILKPNMDNRLNEQRDRGEKPKNCVMNCRKGVLFLHMYRFAKYVCMRMLFPMNETCSKMDLCCWPNYCFIEMIVHFT